VDDAGLAGINQLKELLANPPREVVEEIATETQNHDLLSALAQERAEDVANEFRRRNPGYLKCDANWRSIADTLAHKFLGQGDLDAEDAEELLISGGFWTVENLTDAYKALDKVGALEHPANQCASIEGSATTESRAAGCQRRRARCDSGIREGQNQRASRVRGRIHTGRPTCLHDRPEDASHS